MGRNEKIFFAVCLIGFCIITFFQLSRAVPSDPGLKDLAGRVDSIGRSIADQNTDIEATIDRFTASIDQLGKQVSGLADTVRGLGTDISNIRTGLDGAQSTVGEADQLISGLLERLERLRKSLQ